MGGVAVANGSTLSTTGEMQVTCNAPYVLSVDGVEWSPIASANGVDKYLLSTGGVVRIFINGTRHFIFTNSIVADFTFGTLQIAFFDNNGQVIGNAYPWKSYYQGVLPAGTTEVRIDISSASIPVDDVFSLGITSTNGEYYKRYANNLYVHNIDDSEYCAIFAGNVLLMFCSKSE